MGRVCGNALYYAWTGPEQSSAGGFSISCVRTVRVQGVCSCRTYAFGVFGRLRLLDFFASVRQYQTPCTRTAGHWISEKPPAADCSGPWFWGRLGEGGRFWIFGLCFMGCEGMGGLFGSFRDEANVFYGGVGIVGMGIGYRCFRFFL